MLVTERTRVAWELVNGEADQLIGVLRVVLVQAVVKAGGQPHTFNLTSSNTVGGLTGFSFLKLEFSFVLCRSHHQESRE